MIIFSNRGNLNGANMFTENNPNKMYEFLFREYTRPFHLVLDAWYSKRSGIHYFGSQMMEYPVHDSMMHEFVRSNRVIFKARDVSTFSYMRSQLDLFELNNCDLVYQENENLTITRKGRVWLAPTDDFTSNLEWSKVVLNLPENFMSTKRPNEILLKRMKTCYGVCTNHPLMYKNILNLGKETID